MGGILRAVKGLVGWLNLPGDIRGLWDFAKPWVLPVLVSILTGLAAWFKDAPVWQAVAAIVFAALVLRVGFAIAPGIARLFRSDTTQTQPTASEPGVPQFTNKVTPGPVEIPEDEPYVIERPKYANTGGTVVCLAPFNDLEPILTIYAENPKDVYEVVVNYEVESRTDNYSDGIWKMDIEARLWVVDERGNTVTKPGFYTDTIDVSEGDGGQERGFWRHTVSGNCAFSGLEGTYGLKAVDYTTMRGMRGHARRTYRNMRLRVTRR